jgi:hypothetical protein
VFEEGDFYVICPDNETSSVSWANLIILAILDRTEARTGSLAYASERHALMRRLHRDVLGDLAEPARRPSTRRESNGTSGISSRTDPLSPAGIRLVRAFHSVFSYIP